MAQARKKSEKRQRKNLKAFRLNDGELADFMKNCETANLDGADFFRVKCCSQKPIRAKKRRQLDEKLLAQILGEQGKWGNNLNQVTHALNIAKTKPDAAAVANVFLRSEETLKDIRDAVNTIRDIVRENLLRNDPNG